MSTELFITILIVNVFIFLTVQWVNIWLLLNLVEE